MPRNGEVGEGEGGGIVQFTTQKGRHACDTGQHARGLLRGGCNNPKKVFKFINKAN